MSRSGESTAAPGAGPPTPVSDRRRASLAAVVAVLAIGATALVTRFWRLRWGLADGMWFPDEFLFWREALVAFIPWRWSAFLTADLNYPSLYRIVVGVSAAAAHALSGRNAPPSFVQEIAVGRVIAAVASLGTVAIVGVLARRIDSRAAGWIAAALMAVVPLEAMQVHYVSVDPLLTAGTTATVLLSLRLALRPSRGAAVAAGSAAGLACAAKYTGVFVLAAPAWALVEIGRRAGVRRIAVLAACVALGGLVAASLGCPSCLVSSDRMLAAIQHHRTVNSSLAYTCTANDLVDSLGWYGRPFLYQLVATLPYALGWPLYLAAIIGVVQAIGRRDVGDRLIAATLLVGFLIIGQSRATFPRYVLPLLPLLVVLAARALADAGGRVGWRAVVAGSIWLYTLVLTISQVGRFSYDQQKEVASRIAQAFPAIGQGGAKPRVAIPFGTLNYLGLMKPLAGVGIDRPIINPKPWLKDLPEAVVVSDWVAMALRRDHPGTDPARALDALEAGAAGYREVLHVESSYFSEPLYTALDPAFAADLWQGEIGFRLYLRDDVLPAEGRAPSVVRGAAP